MIGQKSCWKFGSSVALRKTTCVSEYPTMLHRSFEWSYGMLEVRIVGCTEKDHVRVSLSDDAPSIIRVVVRNAGAVVVLAHAILDDVRPGCIHLVLERQVLRHELVRLRDSLGADALRAALREAQQHLILLLVRVLQLAVEIDRRGRNAEHAP